jgi:hypothetical protein
MFSLLSRLEITTFNFKKLSQFHLKSKSKENPVKTGLCTKFVFTVEKQQS